MNDGNSGVEYPQAVIVTQPLEDVGNIAFEDNSSAILLSPSQSNIESPSVVDIEKSPVRYSSVCITEEMWNARLQDMGVKKDELVKKRTGRIKYLHMVLAKTRYIMSNLPQ